MGNQLTKDIHWVGVHFSEPHPGVSINAFLIRDDKTTVIDTGAPASAPFLIANIKAIVDPRTIDYIVITHADVDHIGGLPALLEEAPQATVVTSAYESRGLGYWGLKPKLKIVEHGDRLSLGTHDLQFIAAPFSCMPGTILAFEETNGILFSADLFATLGPPTWQVFNETDQTEMLRGVQSVKLGNTLHTKQALENIGNLPISMIASGHGSVIRDNIEEYRQTLSAQID